jgi:hypothetical protein
MTREGFLRYAATVYGGAESVLRAVPPSMISHRPQPAMMSVSQLIRHMASACGGSFKFVLEFKPDPAAAPHAEPSLDRLLGYETPAEALSHLGRDQSALREAVMALGEEEFQTRVIALPWAPALRVPLWELGLMMVEHLSNHRMQLFQYLRASGLHIDTSTLYGF